VYFDNDSTTYALVYGALYNWYAVETGKLCPSGWHVPTDAEWNDLRDTLGGTSVAGGKLKEVGTVHWDSPNTSATDEVGFTALPGGYRYVQFNDIGRLGIYWRDNRDSSISYDTRFYYNYTYTNKGTSSNITGYSVRCLKD
jgi:uncharacterized protein (TIGR02145 family)